MRFLTLFVCGLLLSLLTTSLFAEPPAAGTYAIAIHGGAGSAPADLSKAEREGRIASLTRVLKMGQAQLAGGKPALDVVEQVIRQLEDDPLFNAGKGAVLNSEGGHELDASIMDGRTLQCGAVASVRVARNPISLARLVMLKTRHVLLAGTGADQFAREMEVPLEPPEYFVTERARKSLERAQKAAAKPDAHKGTVGCVVLDVHGNLAAGTSTGGLTNKKFGRVGDSPIIGAGTYADNRSCAVSCTGVGEHFIRNAIAYDVSARMRYRQQSLTEAVGAVIHKTLKKNMGGAIAVAHDGSIAMEFNTPGMSRAAADSKGRFEVRIGRTP